MLYLNVLHECKCVSVGVVRMCKYLRFPLKDDHTAPFVSRGQELSSVVKLNSGDDISWKHKDKDERRKREKKRRRCVV